MVLMISSREPVMSAAPIVRIYSGMSTHFPWSLWSRPSISCTPPVEVFREQLTMATLGRLGAGLFLLGLERTMILVLAVESGGTRLIAQGYCYIECPGIGC